MPSAWLYQGETCPEPTEPIHSDEAALRLSKGSRRAEGVPLAKSLWYPLRMQLPPEIEIPLAVGAFIVTAVAFIVQLNDRRERRPCYRRHTISIVARPLVDFPDLRISYKGEVIDDLSLTEFFFWNDGRGGFDQKDLDVGKGHQLRISATAPGKIFKPIKLKANDSNGVEIITGDDGVDNNSLMEATIIFKYLNSGEGWAITVRHTGNVELQGTFRNAEDLKHKERPSGGAVAISILAAFAFLMADLLYFAAAATAVFFYFLVAQMKNPAPAKFRKFLDSKGTSLPFP